ncbi:MAG: MFS transporter [Candidatus Heimdallarchaeaceae archaeon]
MVNENDSVKSTSLDDETAVSSSKSNLRSTGVMASYGVGKFLAEFFTGAFGALVFFYFETELGLATWLAAIALVIYSVWNAVNDPIIGFLTEKPTFLSKKLGRRFPWIIFGALVWVFSFVLIFTVPTSIRSSQGGLFAWMVVSICLYDTLYSVWEVNYQSTFVDKFRSHNVRSKAASIAIIIGVIGIAAGALLPTFIVEYSVFEPSYIDNSATFITNGWIFSIAGFLLIFTMIPGVKETPKMIERYLKSVESEEKEGFFKQLRKAFTHKNFLAFILLFFFYQAATMSLTGSIHYVGKYFLGDVGATTPIFAAMLAGALISIPIWLYFIKKVQDNQKMITIAALLIGASFIPMIFLRTQIGFIIALAFWGMSFGGFWLIMTPAMADSIDEIVVKTGKRNDGIFLGFRAFFGRLSYAVQGLSFWAIHELTGFDSSPSATTQTPLAKWGINFHLALIPAILVIVGAIVFWRLNTLNKEKVAEIKRQLKKMDL